MPGGLRQTMDLLRQTDESFLQYVAKEEQEILSNALESFHSVSKDELINVLDAHDCHHLPTESAIKEIVSQLAHKTLIQTPMYVIECWRPVLSTLADTLYPQWLVEITQERIPTPKRVRALLNFPENMSPPQNNVAKQLKKYIGECDDNMLKRFLRFCTGADVLFGQPITIQFIEMSDFQCRPQAQHVGLI
ncbi:hypothetical protein WMY93_026122 [Mugilogobius chulae]|uniref:Uncharacterized protein n=1 Tax=Mugilogobius chulae TaxID=88201 RepID=A0AAW0MWQ5_9GOBI